MNAERLHAIAKALRDDLAQTQAVSLVDQLAAALRLSVQEPNQPTHQQQVATFRAQIDSALVNAPSNEFSPAWRDVARELGIAELLGIELRERIEEIFQRNQITPTAAAEELTEIGQQLTTLSQTIDQLLAGLKGLGIGAEELGADEFEIGILIPRRAVRNELKPLGEELIKLERLLGPFAELATGSRPDFKVRALSSSDFGVFLDSAGPIAACIAVAVERVVALYKQLLEVRELRQKLSDQGVPEKGLAGVNEHAESHMSTGIGMLVDGLIKEFAGNADKARQNELKFELNLSLNAIANRIDQGYNVDVRAGEPPATETDDSEPGGSDEYKAVAASRVGLQFINRSGEPILGLPEPDPGNGSDGQESQAAPTAPATADSAPSEKLKPAPKGSESSTPRRRASAKSSDKASG